MQNQTEILRLGPEAAKDIVDVHRMSFPEEVLRRSIFCSPLVARFVADQLADPAQTFLGAWDRDRLVAYIQLKVLADNLHINYIATRPETRGGGVATMLMESAADEAVKRGQTGLSLDVSRSNQQAVSWYRRIGFSELSCRQVYVLGDTETEEIDNSHFKVNLPEDQIRRLIRYGFAILDIKLGNAHFSVGLLGPSVFRIDCSWSPQLFAALRTLDGDREIIVNSENNIDFSGLDRVDEVLRMERPL